MSDGWYRSAVRILLIGSTGMLGQAVVRVARQRRVPIIGVARSGADHWLDLQEPIAVVNLVRECKPTHVINAAAVTSIELCERSPELATAVNAHAVESIAIGCRDAGARLIQVSTDHFFTGDSHAAHDEHAPVTIVNCYAQTKYLGELAAQKLANALILRTNIVGRRDRPETPTFVEWLLRSLLERRPLTLFDDFYTSSIDVNAFSNAVFDLIDAKAVGLLNLASSSILSKFDFAHLLARRLGIELDWATRGSVAALEPRRAESVGLDIRRAEAILGYTLPDASRVCDNLFDMFSDKVREL